MGKWPAKVIKAGLFIRQKSKINNKLIILKTIKNKINGKACKKYNHLNIDVRVPFVTHHNHYI